MRFAAKIIAVGAILLPCAPATAAVYTLDWSGVIYDGNATPGMFGPSENLIGRTADLTFRVDTGTPGAIRGSDLSGDIIHGFDTTSPVSASVTIGGVTRPIITHDIYVPAPPYVIVVQYDLLPSEGFAIEGDGTLFQSVFRDDRIDVFDADSNQVAQNLTDIATTSVRNFSAADGNVDTLSPGLYTLSPDNYASAYFSIRDFYLEEFNAAAGKPDQLFYSEVAYGHFTPTSLRVTVDVPGSAAPEPAVWAVMILGFGAVGGALRKGPGSARNLSCARPASVAEGPQVKERTPTPRLTASGRLVEAPE